MEDGVTISNVRLARWLRDFNGVPVDRLFLQHAAPSRSRFRGLPPAPESLSGAAESRLAGTIGLVEPENLARQLVDGAAVEPGPFAHSEGPPPVPLTAPDAPWRGPRWETPDIRIIRITHPQRPPLRSLAVNALAASARWRNRGGRLMLEPTLANHPRSNQFRLMKPPSGTTRVFRYVLIERIADYQRLGWTVAADLGPVHGQWSVLMEWLCACRMVEPTARRHLYIPAMIVPIERLPDDSARPRIPSLGRRRFSSCCVRHVESQLSSSPPLTCRARRGPL
jgi:hypothetical protein